MGRKLSLRSVPDEIKDEFHSKIQDGVLTNKQIAEWLNKKGINATVRMVQRYASKLNAESNVINLKTMQSHKKEVERLKILLFDRCFIDLEIEKLTSAILSDEHEEAGR